MLDWMIIVVFALFVTVESTAMIARYAGWSIGSVSLGYSLHNAILALNRFLGFLIGPLIGFKVDHGLQSSELINLALKALVLATVGTSLVYVMWGAIQQSFSSVLHQIRKSGYSIQSFMRFKLHQSNPFSPLRGSLLTSFFLSSAITTGLYVSVAFVLNLVAIYNFSYRGSILQLTGVVTGIGSILLNFYTNPHLAVSEEKGCADDGYFSVFAGKIVGMALVAPVLMTVVWLLFRK